MKKATWLVVVGCALAACVGSGSADSIETSQLGSPPPTVTVSQRSDGLAISWTSISVVSYSVLRGGVPLATVVAPTTSYVDANVFAGSTYCYTVAGFLDDGSQTPPSSQVCAVYGASAVITLPLAAAAFVAETSAHPIDYRFGTASGGSFAARASVPVPVGHQIISVRATIQDSATDPNAKMNLQLISINNNNTNVIASSPVSAGNGAMQTLAISPGTTVQPHMAYQLHVYALGQPSAPVALWFAEVDSN